MNQAITLSGNQHSFAQVPAMPYSDSNLEMPNSNNIDFVQTIQNGLKSIKDMEINMVNSAELMFNTTQAIALGKSALVVGSQLASGHLIGGMAAMAKAGITYGIGEQVEDVVMDFLETREQEAEAREMEFSDIENTNSNIQNMMNGGAGIGPTRTM